jgi:hypothetical protein
MGLGGEQVVGEATQLGHPLVCEPLLLAARDGAAEVVEGVEHAEQHIVLLGEHADDVGGRQVQMDVLHRGLLADRPSLSCALQKNSPARADPEVCGRRLSRVPGAVSG